MHTRHYDTQQLRCTLPALLMCAGQEEHTLPAAGVWGWLLRTLNPTHLSVGGNNRPGGLLPLGTSVCVDAMRAI